MAFKIPQSSLKKTPVFQSKRANKSTAKSTAVKEPKSKNLFVNVKSKVTTHNEKGDIISENRDTDTKRSPWLEDYLCLHSMQMRPVNMTTIETLAREVVDWAHNSDMALKISLFPRSKKIPTKTWYEWVDKYPVLKQAHMEAMRCIGDRREIGVINRELDGTMIKDSMYIYDEEWRMLAEWKNKMQIERAKAAAESVDNKPMTVIFPALDVIKEDIA